MPFLILFTVTTAGATLTIDCVKSKVEIEEGNKASGQFYVFLGDLAEQGNGKLFILKGNNSHLSQYEKFL